MQRATFVTSLAWFVPGAILLQFLLAGLSLFHNTQLWLVHTILGCALALPIGEAGFKGLINSHALRLQARALAQVGIYVSQVILIVVGQKFGSGLLQALHAFNGSLLLLISLVVAQTISLTAMKQVTG